MSYIKKEEMLISLCKVHPDLRDSIVESADEWISLEGDIIWGRVVCQLSYLLLDSISTGEYLYVEETFSCIDNLIEKGDDQVSTLLTTQFLESMLNSRKVSQSLWRPLLGKNAEEYCTALDEFYDNMRNSSDL